MGARLRDIGLAAQRHAAIIMRHEEVGIDPERRLVLRDRLLAPAKRAQDIAEIVAPAGAVRPQRDRAFRLGERFGQPIHLLKQRSEMEVRIDEIGP